MSPRSDRFLDATTKGAPFLLILGLVVIILVANVVNQIMKALL